MPLKKAGGIPEFVTAKAKEVASTLPDATFAIEQLRSERDVTIRASSCHIAGRANYIEVWNEPLFEREHT